MENNLGVLEPDMDVQQENELSMEELVSLAQKALDELEKPQPGEEFPGAEAYKKVMKIVVMASGDDGRIIENWIHGREELFDKYNGEQDREEFLTANGLRSMLEGALVSAQRQMAEKA